jgi:coatomer subunit beta
MSISHPKALEYLSSTFDGVPNADELLQLVELEFIRKDAVQNAQNKVRPPRDYGTPIIAKQ